MFQQLSKYLWQYKQVTIPEVGSFQLVHQSANFDVTSKIIYPPCYSAQYTSSDAVEDHQINFLAADLNTDRFSVQKQLELFGRELKKRIQVGSFFWKGIGRLENKDTQILFHPDMETAGRLQPVSAERVLRDDARHVVLVGEQEVLKSHLPDEQAPVIRKKWNVALIGWILVAIAIAFIFFILYKGGFQTTASGNKTRVLSSLVYSLN